MTQANGWEWCGVEHPHVAHQWAPAWPTNSLQPYRMCPGSRDDDVRSRSDVSYEHDTAARVRPKSRRS